MVEGGERDGGGMAGAFSAGSSAGVVSRSALRCAFLAISRFKAL